MQIHFYHSDAWTLIPTIICQEGGCSCCDSKAFSIGLHFLRWGIVLVVQGGGR